jgi:hypothetical protein
MMIPVRTRCITQEPMTSLAFNPAMASIGNAQKGCTRLVQAFPQATAIAARAASVPSASAAGRITGAWTAYWPPPEGTKKLTTPAERKVQNGSVWAVAKPKSQFEMETASHDPTMIDLIPA